MFQDEASFGRISEPSNCWVPPKYQPTAPSQRIREYKPAYCAVSPADGEVFFIVLEKCNSENMNLFLSELSRKFPEDLILLCVDKASYHTSKKLLKIPANIQFFFLPAKTPEMNPVELIWREVRKIGFKNQAFDSMGDVIIRLNETIGAISSEAFKSLTLWGWIRDIVGF